MEESARLESRLRVAADGRVTILSGKVEFGQGIRTAFARIVAEELDLPLDRIDVVLGDTALVPFDLGTFGSNSVAQDGPVLRRAAAFARGLLLARAAKALGTPEDHLDTSGGAVVTREGGRSIAYAELVREGPLEGPIPAEVRDRPARPDLASPAAYPLRLEARAIVTGRARYVGDVRVPGMARGRVLHPRQAGAHVGSFEAGAAGQVPGVLAVVHDGDFVGVVAERDEQALAAVQELRVSWDAPPPPSDAPVIEFALRDDPGQEEAFARALHVVEATYAAPPIANAPIGPSAAVADVRPEGTTVFAGTQRPFGLRAEAAAILGVPPEQVRVIPQLASGSYGRNSVNDAALEAVRLSRAAGRPVLVQWDREDELGISPARPAVYVEARAALAADGRIAAWQYDEFTNLHTHNPGTYRAVVDERYFGETSGRNALPPYELGPARVRVHVLESPIRTAAFRSLAAAPNVFAIESLMDELAARAAIDPLELRLRAVSDPRMRRVFEAVAERSGWGRAPRADGRALGIAGAVYHGTYVAEVVEVEVERASGRVRLARVWCAIDPGRVVHPEGVRNQTEGGIQQAASWTLLEELRHRHGRVTTTGWDTYPIATFRDAPATIDVAIVGDGSAPSTGAGEPGSVPVAAAVANAIAAACGARVRELPLTPERVRSALR